MDPPFPISLCHVVQLILREGDYPAELTQAGETFLREEIYFLGGYRRGSLL